jgi:hypothetical protein
VLFFTLWQVDYKEIFTHMIISKTKLLSLILLILITIWGCEQKFDNVVDSFKPDYQVVTILPVNDIYFDPSDSLITISVQFINSVEGIQKVFCDIYASDGSKLNVNQIDLLDNGNISNGDNAEGDKIYTNKFPLSKYNPNGTYNIKYFVTDNLNAVNEIAVANFNYNNGQNNVAPIISDDIINPDTVTVIDSTVIQVSLHVMDGNGLSDVEKVYFVVYRPDGSTSGNQNIMFDDGNISLHGDQTAGDGIYSLKIKVYATNTKGTYRFEFQAKDRGAKISNIINHNVLIQ